MASNDEEHNAIFQLINEGFSIEDVTNAISLSIEEKENTTTTIQQLVNAGFTTVDATNAVAISIEENDSIEHKQYKCFCNHTLMKITTSGICPWDIRLCCDICRSSATRNGTFWHCAANEMHGNSFDICSNCLRSYNHISINAKEKNRPSIFRDLFHHIDNVMTFGVDANASTLPAVISRDAVDCTSYVISKDLVVCVSFDEEIDLKSITVYALNETSSLLSQSNLHDHISAPKQIEVYILSTPLRKVGTFAIKAYYVPPEIKHKNPDLFLNNSEPVMLIDNISANDSRFTTVRSIAICIKSSPNDESKTFANAIKFEGTQKQCAMDQRRFMHAVTIYNYATEVMNIVVIL